MSDARIRDALKTVDILTAVEVRTEPPQPPADKAFIYVRDDGVGKCQLCVIFPSGSVQIIATEP